MSVCLPMFHRCVSAHFHLISSLYRFLCLVGRVLVYFFDLLYASLLSRSSSTSVCTCLSVRVVVYDFRLMEMQTDLWWLGLMLGLSLFVFSFLLLCLSEPPSHLIYISISSFSSTHFSIFHHASSWLPICLFGSLSGQFLLTVCDSVILTVYVSTWALASVSALTLSLLL